MFGDPKYNNKNFPIYILGELCHVSSSKRIYQDEQTTTGIPFLRISDLLLKIETGDIVANTFIKEEQFSLLKRKGLVPNAGDLLVTSRGTLGLCYIITDKDHFYFQDGMISWLSDISSAISPQYLCYLFGVRGFREQFDNISNGSTVNYLSIERLKNLRVMCPKKDSQEKFVSFFTQVNKSKYVVQHVAALLQNSYTYSRRNSHPSFCTMGAEEHGQF